LLTFLPCLTSNHDPLIFNLYFLLITYFLVPLPYTLAETCWISLSSSKCYSTSTSHTWYSFARMPLLSTSHLLTNFTVSYVLSYGSFHTGSLPDSQQSSRVFVLLSCPIITGLTPLCAAAPWSGTSLDCEEEHCEVLFSIKFLAPSTILDTW
jgi:hypothetical protein